MGIAHIPPLAAPRSAIRGLSSAAIMPLVPLHRDAPRSEHRPLIAGSPFLALAPFSHARGEIEMAMFNKDSAIERAFILANYMRDFNCSSLIKVLLLLFIHDRIQQTLHVLLGKRPHFHVTDVAMQANHGRLANFQVHFGRPDPLDQAEQLADFRFSTRFQMHSTTSNGLS
jgi:hypothetical protein